MTKEVKHGYPTRVGGRRGFAAVCAALAALAVGAPAGAQLPNVQVPSVKLPAQLPNVQLPVDDGKVGELVPGDAVEETLNEPLPEPVEDVVADSPVAPVRDEVRRAVNGATGGGGTGGGTGGSAGNGTAQSSSSGSGTSTQGSTPGSGQGGTPRGGNTPRGNSRRRANSRRTARRDGAARRAGQVTPGRGAATSAAERSGRDRGPASSTGGNGIARTVERLVQVIPRVVWLALGLLLLASMVLAARTFVERRRARVLAAEREQLLRDVGLLERALLPEVPAQLGALAASVAYRSCEGPAAGGDFYDAFELPGGRAAVLVGDVAGHGQEALERTNAIRAGLHACLEAGMSPSAALASIGERTADSNERLTTVVVAVHDPGAGTLTYSSAGHPPPILTGPGAHEALTVASSPPLGIGRTGLRETSVPLRTGSVACLFTDGLLEARVGDGLFGRERLTAMVAELDPEERADALLEFVVAAADEVPDDMAVFLIRPVSGVEVLAPRIETVELDADDLARGLGVRFLAACEVPDELAEVSLDEARAAVASAGGAVIEVTIDDYGTGVRVSPAGTTAAAATV